MTTQVNQPLKIGITGGIGSGKSYVCSKLHELGIPIYNCDDEAKRLMTESLAIRQGLTTLLGNNAYSLSDDGQWMLNKQLIAQYLFAKKENAEKINSIVHPAVKADFLLWAQKQDSSIIAQECAILFESGFEDTVDYTIEVFAPHSVRLQRAMARDNATSQQIEARMAMQMPEEEKRQRADFCIVNDGEADVQSQIEAMMKRLSD